MRRLMVASLCIIVYGFFFLSTTIVTDWICWHNGYFQAGIQEERELFQ